MQIFYKSNIDYLTENAVNPDKRRYAVVGEAERHYIDIDIYGQDAFTLLPRYWPEAIKKFGEDSLRKHGIVPWHIQTAAYQLTQAFREKNADRIRRLSADIGHYIGDAHVPLHTTSNYNGQKTNQHGIHGLWESRLPELFAMRYDLWIGEVAYRKSIADDVWRTIEESHKACDSVLHMERELMKAFKRDKKFSYELRNNVLTNSYSQEFAEKYHLMLAGQVERRMRAAIKMTGDVWYTCWVNAGQPDLSELARKPILSEKETGQTLLQKLLNIRPEPD